MSQVPQGQPSRYQRSTSGMIGAMVVVLLVTGAYVGFRALNRDNEPTPVRTVDYATWIKAGRSDGKLATFAPTSLPKGWRATSARYSSGSDPRWHLGLLTDKGDYVGVEESLGAPKDVVEQHVDKAATEIGRAKVDGDLSWTAYQDAGGDYALLARPGSPTKETLLVVGSAPDAQIRAFAASLTAK